MFFNNLSSRKRRRELQNARLLGAALAIEMESMFKRAVSLSVPARFRRVDTVKGKKSRYLRLVIQLDGTNANSDKQNIFTMAQGYLSHKVDQGELPEEIMVKILYSYKEIQ